MLLAVTHLLPTESPQCRLLVRQIGYSIFCNADRREYFISSKRSVCELTGFTVFNLDRSARFELPVAIGNPLCVRTWRLFVGQWERQAAAIWTVTVCNALAAIQGVDLYWQAERLCQMNKT